MKSWIAVILFASAAFAANVNVDWGTSNAYGGIVNAQVGDKVIFTNNANKTLNAVGALDACEAYSRGTLFHSGDIESGNNHKFVLTEVGLFNVTNTLNSYTSLSIQVNVSHPSNCADLDNMKELNVCGEDRSKQNSVCYDLRNNEDGCNSQNTCEFHRYAYCEPKDSSSQDSKCRTLNQKNPCESDSSCQWIDTTECKVKCNLNNEDDCNDRDGCTWFGCVIDDCTEIGNSDYDIECGDGEKQYQCNSAAYAKGCHFHDGLENTCRRDHWREDGNNGDGGGCPFDDDEICEEVAKYCSDDSAHRDWKVCCEKTTDYCNQETEPNGCDNKNSEIYKVCHVDKCPFESETMCDFVVAVSDCDKNIYTDSCCNTVRHACDIYDDEGCYDPVLAHCYRGCPLEDKEKCESLEEECADGLKYDGDCCKEILSYCNENPFDDGCTNFFLSECIRDDSKGDGDGGDSTDGDDKDGEGKDGEDKDSCPFDEGRRSPCKRVVCNNAEEDISTGCCTYVKGYCDKTEDEGCTADLVLDILSNCPADVKRVYIKSKLTFKGITEISDAAVLILEKAIAKSVGVSAAKVDVFKISKAGDDGRTISISFRRDESSVEAEYQIEATETTKESIKKDAETMVSSGILLANLKEEDTDTFQSLSSIEQDEIVESSESSSSAAAVSVSVVMMVFAAMVALFL